jgi:uncharacterized protein (TIGR02099 family)
MFIDAPVSAAASAPRSRRARLAARLRLAARWLLGVVIAAWSLVLVAWLTLHWGILPHIDRWKPQIEQRVGHALGVPVEIGNITVRSSGWVPSFELRDIVLRDARGQPALALPHVVAALSPRSLLGLEVRFEQLLIDGAHLEIRRDAKGRFIVGGLELGGPGGSDNSATDWFFRQYEFVIRGGSLQWTDEQRNAPPLALTDVRVVIRNTLRRHDLRLDATPPAEWGERFSLNGRFVQPLLAHAGDWRRWSGVLHAELPRADVRELRRHLDLPFDLSEGDGALRAWVDVTSGEPRGATVDLALRSVRLRLSPKVEPLAFEQVEGRLVGSRSDAGFSVAARQFGFVTGDGVRWPKSDMSLSWRQRAGQAPLGGEFSAERIDLALVSRVATRVPLADGMRKLLDEMAPQGLLTGFSTRWEGALDAPDHYQAQGAIAGLAWRAKPASSPDATGRPGLSRAGISFTATEKGGDAKLAISGGTLEFPGVFAEPVLPLDQLEAQLQWRIDSPRADRKAAPAAPAIALQVRDLRLANADLKAELNASWSTGASGDGARDRRFPGQLDLNGKLTQAAAQRVARYLPLGVGESARRYVSDAVRSGKVTGASFRARGDLADFPFDRLRNPKDGEFHVVAHVEDLDFAYVPAASPQAQSEWPAFSKLSAELVFDRASMEIRNAQARVWGIALSKVQAGIRNLGEKPVLTVDGQAQGPLADLLRFVAASPVAGWTGKALSQATGTGDATLQLGLTIPLLSASDTAVKGSLTLLGNDLRISPDTPALDQTQARIDFTQKGFRVAAALARSLGGDVSINGGSASDGSVRFSAQGVATAEGLRRANELGALSRLAGAFGGQASYRATLGVIHGRSELSVASNLVGLSSDLPPPLRKSAEAALPLRLQTALLADASAPAAPASRDTVRLDLGSLLQLSYLRDLSGDTPRVIRGGIGLQETAPQPASGVAANINIASLDSDAWSAAVDRLIGSAPGDASAAAGQPSDYLPSTVALRAQELVTHSRRLTRLVAGAVQEDGIWRANLDAEQLSGYVEYRPPRRGAGAGRVHARLARLAIPKSDDAGVDSLLDSQASAVPALDIVVDDFELHGKKLGRLEVDAVNRGASEGAREWRLNRLALTMPEARFAASGNWVSTGPPSPGAATRRRATMDFKLDITDSGALLQRLGSGGTVRGGKGSLAGQVSWLGSPLSLDYPSLGGQIKVALASGQFLKTEPGAARLLSVLSLQALPRRFLLDFRDVFEQGFAFDSAGGDVSIKQGVAYTNNLRMRGVQAVVLMEGSTDLDKETQDLRVVIVPEINAGTASLAYAVINPAIGLGTFLAQYVLRKPLVQAGTRELRVTGSWGEPKIDRVERKLTEPVPDINAPLPPTEAASAPSPDEAASAAESESVGR